MGTPSYSGLPEDLGKRTLTTKHYIKGNGQFVMRSFQVPVHYYDGQGVLQDRDTTIVDGGAYYEVAKTEFPLRVKKNFLAPNLIRYQNNFSSEKHIVTISPAKLAWVNNTDFSDRVVVSAPQNVNAVVNGKTITFPNAYGAGIDFEVTVLATGFRKNLVLNNNSILASQPTPQHKLVFLVEIDTGLTNIRTRKKQPLDTEYEVGSELERTSYLEGMTAYSIGEVEKTNILTARIFSSDVISSGDLPTTEEIKMFWIKRNDKRYLGKILPTNFLQNATYPVRADATVNGTLNQDNWLDANQPTTNWDSALGFFRVGDQGGSDGARGIVRFTMPSDPSTSTIDLVECNFPIVKGSNASNTINLHHGTNTACTSWVENQSTWNIYSTGNNWTAGGGLSDFSTTVVDSQTFNPNTEAGTEVTFVIFGTGATNPITVDYDDVVNLLLVAPSSAGWQCDIDHDEDATVSSITVTYTVGSASSSPSPSVSSSPSPSESSSPSPSVSSSPSPSESSSPSSSVSSSPSSSPSPSVSSSPSPSVSSSPSPSPSSAISPSSSPSPSVSSSVSSSPSASSSPSPSESSSPSTSVSSSPSPSESSSVSSSPSTSPSPSVSSSPSPSESASPSSSPSSSVSSSVSSSPSASPSPQVWVPSDMPSPSTSWVPQNKNSL